MIYRTTTYIVGLLAGLCCLSPASADPLGDLLSSAGGGVCFARSYDAAHLARDPKQDTRRAQLSLVKDSKFGGATMRIALEGKARTAVITKPEGPPLFGRISFATMPAIRPMIMVHRMPIGAFP